MALWAFAAVPSPAKIAAAKANRIAVRIGNLPLAFSLVPHRSPGPEDRKALTRFAEVSPSLDVPSLHRLGLPERRSSSNLDLRGPMISSSSAPTSASSEEYGGFETQSRCLIHKSVRHGEGLLSLLDNG